MESVAKKQSLEEELAATVDPCEAIKMREIIRAVAKQYGISMSEIRSARRNDRLVKARQIAMYLCRTLTARSYPEIGIFLSKDHSTVIYGGHCVMRRISESPEYAREINSLTDRIIAREFK